MTRVEEFDAFYVGTRRHVLHLAYAFTGDLPAAAGATQDAYAAAWQHWSKLRGGEPVEAVRRESLRVAALRHGAHLVRRKPPPEADGPLLSALRGLSSSARRLLLLQTLADVDLAQTAREMGLNPDEGASLTGSSRASLEQTLGTSMPEIERRLHAMHALSDAIPLPGAAIIRRTGGRRQLRNTALAVAASTAVLLGGGYLVTAPAQPAQSPPSRLTTTPAAQGTQPLKPTGPTVVADQLLRGSTLTDLDGDSRWRERVTSDDLTDQTPLASCAEGRFASKRLHVGFTRTFSGDRKQAERAVQTVELARSAEAAQRAYDAQLAWYSGCQEPRLQLLESFRARRASGDTTILVMRQWSDPTVTMNVGVARTGAVMTTFVHQGETAAAMGVRRFGSAMDAALGQLCLTAGGTCEASRDPAPTAPPPTREGPGFLGVVDMPPVAGIAKVWGGTKPLRWRPEPPATPCEGVADFSAASGFARSRNYVIPEAEHVPLTFGVSETIARFPSTRAAHRFIDRVSNAVGRCDDANLGADISSPSTVDQAAVTATSWLMSFSVADDQEVTYRLGMVVNRDRVAQVTLSPVDGFDIGGPAYERLLLRAGQRLVELPEPRTKRRP